MSTILAYSAMFGSCYKLCRQCRKRCT